MQETSERVGVAVVGAGAMGAIHARTYQDNPRARLVGVCDLEQDKASRVARELGVAAFRDLHQLLDAPGLTAVSICTSDAHHADPAVAACAAGKHVPVEKPIATSLGDADRICAAAAAAGVTLLVGHVVRFDPRYLRVKQMADNGDLGHLVSIYARRLNSVASQDVLAGRVSPLMFLGVHDLDYVRWLAGSEARRVSAESGGRLLRGRGYQIDDMSFVLVRFSNGVIGCVEAGFALPDTHPRGGDFQLEAIGTGGVANIDLSGQGLEVTRAGQGNQRPGFGHSVPAEIDHFLDCITRGDPPLATGSDGRAALELVLAAEQAAATHQPVSLPLTDA